MQVVNWTLFRAVKANSNYEVSIHGLVRNRKTKRILKPFIIGAGYEAVKLSNKGEVKICYVHQLVGEAFIDSKGLREINHKDEEKTNNEYSNLEFCTHRYNINYGTGQQRRRATRERKRRSAHEEVQPKQEQQRN